MKLPSNAHPKIRAVFRNGVLRSEVETLILLTVNASCGKFCFVKDFVNTARFMESDATDKQIAYVAEQMAETGELKRITVSGNYAYQWWADVEQA